MPSALEGCMHGGAASSGRSIAPPPFLQATPRLSIVMPCLNEAETLARCIRKAQNALSEMDFVCEVVIADNGSTDGSQEIARLAGARVVEIRQKGYGCALRGGIAAARGEWIIMGDADDSYDFGSIAPFVEKLREGFDLVMGCRLPSGKGQIMDGAMPWKHRWIGNPSLTFLGRLFFRSPANDFYCGLRAFSKQAYTRMKLSATGMEFACEMVIQASLKKMQVSEVPITLHKDGRSRPSHLKTWRDGWRTLRFMLLHCPRWLFFLPGAAVLVFGVALGTRLSLGPIQIGTIGFDVSSLLVCSMCVVVGVQLSFFGAFAREFATTQGWLPPNRRLRRSLNVLNLERSICLGGVLVIGGFILLGKAVLAWKGADFGPLSYPDSLRRMIPAVTLVTVGVQWLFSSFFLNLLHLRQRSARPIA